MSRPPKFSSEIQRTCFKVLTQLKRHAAAGPFMEPVDPITLQLEDYYDIIKEPMDLQTVESHLRGLGGQAPYQTLQEFTLDVRKIWNNSFRYNTYPLPYPII